MLRHVLISGFCLVCLLTPIRSAFGLEENKDRASNGFQKEKPEEDKSKPQSPAIIKVKAILPGSKAEQVMTPEMIARRSKVERCLASYYPAHVNADVLRPWSIMHGLIAFGQDTLVMSNKKRIDAVDYLCANGVGNDRRILYVKNGKLQARKGDGYQGHHGQLLAMLAQSDVPIDHPIQVDGKTFTVADLVELEKKSCRSKSELTWQLIGLAHYLDSDARWKNSLGQNWNIPRMISEEIVQPINGAACGGTHRLMGLSYAVQQRKKEDKPIEGQWRRADNFVKQYHKYTMELQNPDGSFSTDWFEGLSNSGTKTKKISTTGHILEWLIFSMPADQLNDPIIDDAIDYLVDAMLEVPKNQYGVGPKTVGPKGHALRSLRLYEIAMYGESSDYHQTVSDENAIRDFNIAQQALAHQEEYLQRIGNRQKREPGPVRSRGIFRRR